MRRAILIALLAIASSAGGENDLYWRALDADFVATWNRFSVAANELIGGRKVKWDVKDAREVARLYDKVYNHPLYRK